MRTLIALTVVAGLLFGCHEPAWADGYRGAVISGDVSTVKVPALLRRIRGCESGGWNPHAPGDYRAKNPGSSASGAYQMLNSTWRSWARTYGRDVRASRWSQARYAPRRVQDVVAVRAFKKLGTRPWAESRACWR